MTTLTTDYLIVGSGAVGMAFADTLLSESDADMIIVDRHHAPGGHWNDAYPFVRLHQPSAFYGVASRSLGGDRIDEVGSNQGYFELATGTEVVAYFEQVMRERFLPSKRVRYFPMHEITDDGQLRSLLNGKTMSVSVSRRTVDGTFFNTSVPSTHERKYAVAEGVTCITPNELPRRAGKFRTFTVVGAGKTGMDAAVWLLDNGADPESISWICPRDSWLIDRATTQAGAQFFPQAIGGAAHQMEACAQATSCDALFDDLEARGQMIRINPDIRPTMFHYATISKGELSQLRSIKRVLRQGRVEKIDPDQIHFQNGDSAPGNPDTLYVDCTATAVQFSTDERVPVFEKDKITLQSVRTPLMPFSASVTAYLEAHYDDDEKRNELATPVMIADTPEQWMSSTLGNMKNQYAWSQQRELSRWIKGNRLDPFANVLRTADKTDPDNMAIFDRLKTSMMPAAMNLQKLIADAAD